jgi:signal transduction histidine kinase
MGLHLPHFLAPVRGLSGRLLLLTILFVLIGEVLIYVPSIARFRMVFLNQRLDAGQLATRALEAAPEGRLEADFEARLLAEALVEGVVLRHAGASMLMLSAKMPPTIDASYDLRQATPAGLIFDAFRVLWPGPERVIRVLGASRMEPGMEVEVVLREGELRAQMIDYSRRILNLSIVLSLLTAGLVYFTLQWMIVRPMRRITENLGSFRRNPENATNQIEDTRRTDEIGRAQQALRTMQSDLRAALLQKTRLAALGSSMSKINHDLRNTLASAMIDSDRLAQSEDPEVQRVTPRLMTAIDRAVNLCSQTLEYAQSVEPNLEPTRFPLRDLIDDVGEMVGLPPDSAITWHNDVAGELTILADRVQMFRVLLNLGHNAVEAMGTNGSVRFEARRSQTRIVVEVSDTGPGLPPRARENLFQPFAGSARPGGTGLGLAIVREIVRFHGGEIELVETSVAGTRFRMTLPAT